MTAPASFTRAFAKLRKSGLIALQRFQCCASCAESEIAYRYSCERASRKRTLRGYAYYHKQDADRLDSKGYAYLGYGTLGDHGDNTAAIGALVRDTFLAEGCPVDWDGDPKTRLLVWESEHAKRASSLNRIAGTAIKKSA